MSEQTVWTGRSSQWKNLGPFLACLLVVPIPWALWRWLAVRMRVFRLTNERLLVESGVLNRSTEVLELYRVRDFRITQPFWLRLVGLHDIALVTSDSTMPELVLDCIPAGLDLPGKLRRHVEECRERKRVREIDIE